MIPYFSLLWTSLLGQTPPDNSPDVLYFVLVDRFANGNTQNDWFVDTTDPQGFHGGDLYGVTKHLNHIEYIGADAIWLSPIYEMRTEKFHGHGAFHGYWTEDLTQIASHMGGEQGLQTLSDELEARNMSMLLDIVYNHTSFDAPLLTTHPDWFHEAKPIENWNDPLELTTHQVHGLPDLDQSHPAVYAHLLEISRTWLDHPAVDGLRVDAIRHMNSQFIQQIHEDLDGAWMLGEDFQGNPMANIQRFEDTGIDALFDFPFYYALTNGICDGKSLEEMASILSLDAEYPPNSHLVRFLDNHDLPRIFSRCHQQKHSVLLAEMVIFGLRGTPMISYGTEHWSEGSEEPDNRQDMDWDNLDPMHIHHLKTLATFRNKHPVFKHGIPKVRHVSKDELIVEQHWHTAHSMLAINRSNTPLPVTDTPCRKGGEGLFLNDTIETIDTIPSSLEPGQALLWVCTGKRHKDTMEKITIHVEGSQDRPPLIVGAHPRLGGWNPDLALVPNWQSGHWITTLTLPRNTVSAYKLVYATDDGFEWENGDNRFLHSTTDKSFWIR